MVNNWLDLVIGVGIDDPIPGGSIRQRFDRGEYRAGPGESADSLDVFLESLGESVITGNSAVDESDHIVGATVISLEFDGSEIIASEPCSLAGLEAATQKANAVLARLGIAPRPRLYLRHISS